MICDPGAIETYVCEVVARFPPVLVAYHFGSGAAGKPGPLSDVDIAVLLDPSVDGDAVFGQVEDELSRRLRTERLDLILLNRAPSSLAYHVIRDGRLIFCRDKKARERFESGTVLRYLDLRPLRERAFQTARSRILEAV